MTSPLIYWVALTLLLFGAEALLPGAFLMWLGFAAGVMALVMVFIPNMDILPQTVLFAAFTIISLFVYARWFRGRGKVSDKPLLNLRAQQLIGQTTVLKQAIVRGRGRVQIGDAFWDVEGPDLPEGTAVRVVSIDGMTLRVQEA